MHLNTNPPLYRAQPYHTTLNTVSLGVHCARYPPSIPNICAARFVPYTFIPLPPKEVYSLINTYHFDVCLEILLQGFWMSPEVAAPKATATATDTLAILYTSPQYLAPELNLGSLENRRRLAVRVCL
ncbi:hypothetical protein FRC19_001749 [Serendipita sp. 401]|nr:hypothetical protein FRC19_001749 [Serendipita sp. 401]